MSTTKIDLAQQEVAATLADWLDYQVAWLGGRLAEARTYKADLVADGMGSDDGELDLLVTDEGVDALHDGLVRLAAWLRGATAMTQGVGLDFS